MPRRRNELGEGPPIDSQDSHRQPAEPCETPPVETDQTAGGPQDSPRVVLALRSSYFPDGRVDEERYESDLAPSFVASLNAARQLLSSVLFEAGAAGDEIIEVHRGRHVVCYGPGRDQIQILELPTTPSHQDQEGSAAQSASPWLRAVTASRDADHGSALRSFEQEAATAVKEGLPQRAAVAYRSASAAARAAGRGDDANRLLRLAGKSYLEIAESRESIPQGVFLAYREAARCLLEAGNLPLAQTSLAKAIAVGETLGYTDASPRAS